MKSFLESKKILVILLTVFLCLCVSGCNGYRTEQPLDNMPINGSFTCDVGPANSSYDIGYEGDYSFSDVMVAKSIVLELDSAKLVKCEGGDSVPCTVELKEVLFGTAAGNTYVRLGVTYSGLEYDTKYELYIDGRFKAYNRNEALIATSDELIKISTGDAMGGRLYLITTSQPESSHEEASVHEDASAHVHNFSWVRTKEPTLDENGVSSLICSECGDVEQTVPINNDMVVYEDFANELEEQIKTAEEGDILKLDMKAWHSVPSFLMERIINCGRNVELIYKYNGVRYDILIKAGQGQNLNIPWYGPLLMNSLYGN